MCGLIHTLGRWGASPRPLPLLAVLAACQTTLPLHQPATLPQVSAVAHELTSRNHALAESQALLKQVSAWWVLRYAAAGNECLGSWKSWGLHLHQVIHSRSSSLSHPAL